MKIGLLGAGTIGFGVVEIADKSEGLEIVKILDRRQIPELADRLTADPDQILSDPVVDTVVELLGGVDPAFDWVQRALLAGKHVVTANKLLVSTKLAELLDADMLIILTAVEKVAINFNKPDQKGLDDLTPAEAYEYIDQGQFAKGSMLPKVQAAVKFAESKKGRVALITLLEKAGEGIQGKTGTRVHQ